MSSTKSNTKTKAGEKPKTAKPKAKAKEKVVAEPTGFRVVLKSNTTKQFDGVVDAVSPVAAAEAVVEEHSVSDTNLVKVYDGDSLVLSKRL